MGKISNNMKPVFFYKINCLQNELLDSVSNACFKIIVLEEKSKIYEVI